MSSDGADRREGHFIEQMFQREPEYAHLRSIMDEVTNPSLSHRERIVLAMHLTRGMDRFTQEEDLLRLILKTRTARKHGIVATDLYVENDDSPRTANVSVLFGSCYIHHICAKFTLDLDNPNSSWQVDDFENVTLLHKKMCTGGFEPTTANEVNQSTFN
jgi:hypothetical protein